jgi:penicillin amidase
VDHHRAVRQQPKPRLPQITFRHPLAITQEARRTYNVGPFAIGGYADTVMSVTSRSGVDIGASFRMIVDVAEWDRSVATMAPGQAERPEQPHFSDLAAPWAKGEYFPLLFSDLAIRANSEWTVGLQPR